MPELIEERSRIRSRFTALLDTWRLSHTDSVIESDVSLPARPYPGLRSFMPWESQLFFGRRNQVQELRRRLMESNAILVMGGSGSGKSSLVKAGLLPSLKTVAPVPNRLGRWHVAECRPRTNPSTEVVEALWRDVCEPLLSDGVGREAVASGFSDTSTADARMVPPQDPRERFSALVQERAPNGCEPILDAYGISEFANVVLDAIDSHLLEHLRTGNANLLIVIDQFEEIFDDSKVSPESRDAVISLIDLARRNRGQALFIILTMRSEALHRCAEDPRLVDLVNQSSFLLELIDQQEVSDAIVRPARAVLQAWGLLPFESAPADSASPFTPSLVATLSDELVRLRCNLSHKPDSLPLLQHTLEAIWDHAMERWAVSLGEAVDVGELKIEEKDFQAVCQPARLESDRETQFPSEPFRYCLDVRADKCRLAAAKILEKTRGASPEMAERVLAAVFSTLARRDDRGNWAREFSRSANMLATNGAAQLAGFTEANLIHALGPFVDAGYLQARQSAKEGRAESGRGELPGSEGGGDVAVEYCVGHEALIRGWSWCSAQLRRSENLRKLLVTLDDALTTRRERHGPRSPGSLESPMWLSGFTGGLPGLWRWLLAEREKEAADLLDPKQTQELQDIFGEEPVYSKTWALNCLMAHRREVSRRQDNLTKATESVKQGTSATEQETLVEIIEVIKNANRLPRARWRLPLAGAAAVGSTLALCGLLLYQQHLTAEVVRREESHATTTLAAQAATAIRVMQESRAGHITTDLKIKFLEKGRDVFWQVFFPFEPRLSYLRSQQDRRRARDLLHLSEALFDIYVDQGRVDDLREMNTARQRLVSAFGHFDQNRLSQHDLYEVYKSKKSEGWTRRKVGDVREALRNFEEFSEGMNRLLRNSTSPKSHVRAQAEWYKDQVDGYEAVGDMLASNGDDALPTYQKLLDVAKSRINLLETGDGRLDFHKDPDLRYWYGKAAKGEENVGDIYRQQGNVKEAHKHYMEFEKTMEKLIEADPWNVAWRRSAAQSHQRVGDTLRAIAEAVGGVAEVDRANNSIKAEQEYERFLGIIGPLQAYDSKNAEFLRFKALALERKGDLLLFKGELKEAQRAFEAEKAIAQELTLREPANIEFRRDFSLVREKFGDLKMQVGRPEVAREIYLEVESILSTPNPSNVDWARDRQLIYERLADAYWLEGNVAEAAKAFDKCADMTTAAVFDPRNGLLFDEIGNLRVKKRFGEPSDVKAYCERGLKQVNGSNSKPRIDAE